MPGSWRRASGVGGVGLKFGGRDESLPVEIPGAGKWRGRALCKVDFPQIDDPLRCQWRFPWLATESQGNQQRHAKDEEDEDALRGQAHTGRAG